MVDGPIFNKKIDIQDSEIKMESEICGECLIKKAILD